VKNFFSFTVFFAILATPACARAQTRIERSLRLKPGNYWVYKGTVAWSCSAAGHPDHVCRKPIFWKSEILEQQARGSLKAYLVNGSFDDLPWYTPGKKPDRYLWVVYANRFYTLRADDDLARRLHDPQDSLLSLLEKEQPVLQFPLQTGRCTEELKPEEPRQRNDLMYCWHVVKQQAAKIRRSNGRSNRQAVWTAMYQTGPDDERLKFVPGMGFISFDYNHHGTASEAHVHLAKARLR
jgi:hypothetical protein